MLLSSLLPTGDCDENASWFPVDETHAMPLSPRSQVVMTSAGLGWRNAFASVTSGREWSARTPRIAHASFAYCLRGTNRVEREIEGEGPAETMSFRPGQLGILPTHASAGYKVTGGADVLLIYLRGEMMRSVARELGTARSWHLRPRMGFVDPLLEQLCLGFVAALNRQDPIRDPRYVDHLAEMAAAHCLRNHRLVEDAESEAVSTSTALPQFAASVHRVRRYIDANLDGDLSLDMLAREAGLPPPTLTQAFTRVQGVTPHQYVMQRRVEQASGLLMSASLPLAEIALRTGFASQSHFSAVFKKVTSLTPNEFRRAR
jgi:AraC family transcriptional regulator